jgi:signal peptidase I
MRTPSTAQKLVAGALALLTLALAWFFLAPTFIGGSTTYVVTDGVSMQPHFHTGDIALVRGRPSYHVGEIVAYRSRTLNTIVLHRIVGKAGDRYLFKGDNNDFIDPEHPRRSQLVGALWVRLPTLAQRLAPLRGPATIGSLVALGVLLLGGGALTQRRKRRGRRRPDATLPRAHPTTLTAPVADWPHHLVAIGAAVFTPLLALAVIAYARPVTTLAPVSVPYTQHGTFAYSADTAWGAAYPHGRATTGDPLFLRLVHTLQVRMAYRFDAAGAHRISGTTSLSARITSSTGWKRTIALQGTKRFTGDRAVLGGTLDLRSLPSLLHKLEASTSVPSTYSLKLVPHVRVKGQAGDLPLRAVFATPLDFSLTDLELQPALPPAGAANASAGNPLTPSSPGTATGSRSQPNVLSFKIFRVRVTEARSVALRALVTALCALVGVTLAIALGRDRRPRAAASIQARYRRLIVPVAQVQPSQQVVELAGIEALASIAEHYERMILHEHGDDGDTYSVADDGVLYRYAVPANSPEPDPEPEPAPPAPVALTAVPALRDRRASQRRSA